ncbi:DUF6913 domain-containing protein [Belliella marina]|uniref:DUF6913 domain-containing protein n=1 Tax=Belliella marina TaxID=1644146 RepID=A0ABW4VQ14_9BACT
MMDSIKKYFVKNRIRKSILDKSDTPSFPSEVQFVGVLANSEEEFAESKEVLTKYFGKAIEISGFYHSDTEKDDAMSGRDYGLFGRPKERIERFLEKKLDFILVPSLNLNPYLLYLLLHSNSGLKIGFFSPESREYLELMLDKKNKDLKENIQDLLDYYIKIKEAC